MNQLLKSSVVPQPQRLKPRSSLEIGVNDLHRLNLPEQIQAAADETPARNYEFRRRLQSRLERE